MYVHEKFHPIVSLFYYSYLVLLLRQLWLHKMSKEVCPLPLYFQKGLQRFGIIFLNVCYINMFEIHLHLKFQSHLLFTKFKKLLPTVKFPKACTILLIGNTGRELAFSVSLHPNACLLPWECQFRRVQLLEDEPDMEQRKAIISWEPQGISVIFLLLHLNFTSSEINDVCFVSSF